MAELKVLTTDYAASLTQAEITPCTGVTEPQIREFIASAIEVSRVVQNRLHRFDGRRGQALRQDLWNSGPEYKWFSTYSSLKLLSLKLVFRRIPEILAGRRLKVSCDPTFPFYADSNPGIHKILLGQKWLNPHETRSERIQTFVHEANHIAGRWVVDEDPWYGEGPAQAMARVDRPGRPLMMMRSADNLGYYAIDLSENPLLYSLLARH